MLGMVCLAGLERAALLPAELQRGQTGPDIVVSEPAERQQAGQVGLQPLQAGDLLQSGGQPGGLPCCYTDLASPDSG